MVPMRAEAGEFPLAKPLLRTGYLNLITNINTSFAIAYTRIVLPWAAVLDAHFIAMPDA